MSLHEASIVVRNILKHHAEEEERELIERKEDLAFLESEIAVEIVRSRAAGRKAISAKLGVIQARLRKYRMRRVSQKLERETEGAV
jgi:hypothetical protein